MADFICLAMATQYTEQDGSDNNSNNSFRRSLNLGQGALFGTGRRLSRSTTSNMRPGSNSFESAIIEESAVHPTSQIASPVHVRIVPSIDNPSRSLVFSIIERDLEAGRVIKIGRFTDRISIQNHISFKSKVVSRSHCEIWLDNDGKVCLRDTKSSSGTFLNHVRLSPANQESRPVEIRDGDLVQLGVDYQGGLEEIYRAVKMRFEINRPQQQRPVSYSMSAFNNLRNLTHISTQINQDDQSNGKQIIYGNQNKHVTELSHHTALACYNNIDCSSSGSHHHDVEGSSDNGGCGGDGKNDIQVEECCICLYALAPFQALFVAPCSHSYHFKCIRPLLDSYPGFQCPICRTYSDLDESVAIEAEEVIEKFGLRKPSVPTSPIHHEGNSQNNQVEEDSGCPSSNVQINNSILEESVSSEAIPTTNNVSSSTGHQYSDLIPSQTILYSAPVPEPPLSTTLVACTTSLLSGILSEQHVDARDYTADHRATIIMEDNRNNNVINNCPFEPIQSIANDSYHQPVPTRIHGERRTSSANLVEKIKMAFSPEKRKSMVLNSKKQRGDSTDRTDYDMSSSSSSSPPSSPGDIRSLPMLTQFHSRQSTQNSQLSEITEENVIIQNNV